MSKETVKNLVGHIISGNLDHAKVTFEAIFKDKYNAALEAKKIAVAARIYSEKPKGTS